MSSPRHTQGTLAEAKADYIARRDITDAVHRYMRALDRLDGALLASAFHPDAHIDCGLYVGGPAGFGEFALGFLGQMQASHHMLGQVSLDLHSAGKASGECYFQAWHGINAADAPPRDLIIAGRYIDEYACRGGIWAISHRKLITDWVSDTAADHSFYAANPATNRGARGGADFSQNRQWPTAHKDPCR